MPLAEIADRLFPHYGTGSLETDESRAFLTLRLAEEGDRRDLRWLISRLGEEELARILGRHGGRQLSARSAAFWHLVLALPGEPEAEAARRRELWPL